MSEKRAIVVVSIGDRGWCDVALETVRRYAAKCKAQLRIERNAPSKSELALPDLPDRPGRRNKLAYACKTYFAWRCMEELAFERVLVVDDTCCIRSTTPDVFDLVPRGSYGFTATNHQHAEDSFSHIRDFLARAGRPDIVYDPERYMNSAVMVYCSQMRDAIHKDRIVECADLLKGSFPHQTLSYYLLQAGGIPSHLLPKAFNRLPGLHLGGEKRRRMKHIVRHLKDDVFIYHVSGFYRNRRQLVQEMGNKFIREWDRRSADSASGAPGKNIE